jgi:hypothetical protein
MVVWPIALTAAIAIDKQLANAVAQDAMVAGASFINVSPRVIAVRETGLRETS